MDPRHVQLRERGTSGNCDGAAGIAGDSHDNGGQGNQLVGDVIDGSDSDLPVSASVLWDCYDVHDSIIRYASQGLVCNNMHTFHDNLIEYINESSDGQTHSNGFEFNSEWPGNNTVYNNVVRHLSTAVSGWVNPNATDYVYNNVTYDTLGQNWDVDTTGGGTLNFYNNTVDDYFFGSPLGNWSGILRNNILIDAGSVGSPSVNANSTVWTGSQATSAGYTAANNYAPTSSSCNGITPCPIAAGANLTSSCGAAGSALCSDTTLGVNYDAVNHVAVYPARTTNVRPASGFWMPALISPAAAATRRPRPFPRGSP